MNATVAYIRQRLFIQAAITALLALLPANADNSTWLTITLALAAGCVAVGALIPTLGTSAYQTVLGWEIVAVAIGAWAITQGTYIPGTIVGVFALFRLLDGNTKAAFLAGAAPQQQYAAPQQAAPQFGPQFGNPQFGNPQVGVPPQPQPTPQLGMPQYAPPPVTTLPPPPPGPPPGR